MDEDATPSPANVRPAFALFLVSVVGLILALGLDEIPFDVAPEPFATVAEVALFGALGILLYTVGRLGTVVGEIATT